MSATAERRLPASFPYVGGKWRMAGRLIGVFPEHRAYVEVFGGSGAVLLAKPRVGVEVVNDVDGEIVNFFRVVREEATRRELMERMLWTPYSREVFETLVRSPVPECPVEQAWRFYCIARMMFGGYRSGRADRHGVNFAPAAQGRWRRSMDLRADRQAGGRDTATLHRQIDRLDEIGERLRGVFIERKDFTYIVDKWDRPETLFYCDPPYIGTEGYYNNGDFGAVRHADLADMLGRIGGRAVVSYYPHEDLDRLYPADRWRRVA